MLFTLEYNLEYNLNLMIGHTLTPEKLTSKRSFFSSKIKNLSINFFSIVNIFFAFLIKIYSLKRTSKLKGVPLFMSCETFFPNISL